MEGSGLHSRLGAFFCVPRQTRKKVDNIKYLNRKDKTTVQIIAAYVAYMNDLIKTWEQHKVSKTRLKALRTSRTWADKALQEMLTEVDPAEIAKVMMEAGKMEVIAQYRDSAKREYEKMKALDDVTPVNTEHFYDLAELCIVGYCQKCKLSGSEANECRIRRHFLRYDVAPLKLEVEDGECPYQY